MIKKEEKVICRKYKARKDHECLRINFCKNVIKKEENFYTFTVYPKTAFNFQRHTPIGAKFCSQKCHDEEVQTIINTLT